MSNKRRGPRAFGNLAVIFAVVLLIMIFLAVEDIDEGRIVSKELISKAITVEFNLVMTIDKIGKSEFRVTAIIPAVGIPRLDMENLIKDKIREKFRELYPDRKILGIKKDTKSSLLNGFVYLVSIEMAE